MSLLARHRAGAALRQMQAASRTGRHDAAARLCRRALEADPALPHVHLHAALDEARQNRLDAALGRLDEAPAALAATPPYRLFRGFLLARARRLGPAEELLRGVLAEQPHNRVAATALAYALFRHGEPEAAVEALRAGAGDNFELLSWAWLEMERAALAEPPRPEPPLPDPGLPADVTRAVARRWLKAGIAAAERHSPMVWQGRLRRALERDRPPLWARPLTPLSRWLERRRPSDALRALLAVRGSGHAFDRFAFQLGAQLFDDGFPAAAMPELEAACAAMAESEEAWLPRIFRAAALVELRRWDEAESALAEMAKEAEADQAVGVHEFAAPHWLLCRARVRLARGQDDLARRHLEHALEGEPALFEERFRALHVCSDRDARQDSGVA